MATPILNFTFHIFAMNLHQYYEKIIILYIFTSEIYKNKIKNLYCLICCVLF